jgi:hypothetical protein
VLGGTSSPFHTIVVSRSEWLEAPHGGAVAQCDSDLGLSLHLGFSSCTRRLSLTKKLTCQSNPVSQCTRYHQANVWGFSTGSLPLLPANAWQ